MTDLGAAGIYKENSNNRLTNKSKEGGEGSAEGDCRWANKNNGEGTADCRQTNSVKEEGLEKETADGPIKVNEKEEGPIRVKVEGLQTDQSKERRRNCRQRLQMNQKV